MQRLTVEKAADTGLATHFEALRKRVVSRDLPRSDPEYREVLARMEALARQRTFLVGAIVYRWNRFDRSLERSAQRVSSKRPSTSSKSDADPFIGNVRVYHHPDACESVVRHDRLGIAG